MILFPFFYEGLCLYPNPILLIKNPLSCLKKIIRATNSVMKVIVVIFMRPKYDAFVIEFVLLNTCNCFLSSFFFFFEK